MGKGHKLENVAIRMVKAPPLYSSEPLKTPMDVVRVLGKELEAYDREVLCVVNLRSDLAPINMNIVSMGSLNASIIVATHLSCPKINQIDCHRMNRYNGISLKKGKVPGHLQFRHR
jgi:hypothetical protein